MCSGNGRFSVSLVVLEGLLLPSSVGSGAAAGESSLTENVGGFIPRFGFAPTERWTVPFPARRFFESASACPESARVMGVDL